MKTTKVQSADNRPARRRVASPGMPSSPRQRAGRRSEANADQVKPAEPVIVRAVNLKVALRCTRTGAVVLVASFLRLRAEDGTGRIDQLSNHVAGTPVFWNGEKYEVIR